MRIILSPAKQMVRAEDVVPPAGDPALLASAREMLSYLQKLSYPEAKALWGCSEKLAQENFQELAGLSLDDARTPAILAFDGIAYKYMAPSVFENAHLAYVQEHLRILSGLYGVLRPLDGVIPYRLEMQAKAHVKGAKDLYAYWGDALFREVADGSHVFVNLASKEYSKCIAPYLTRDDRMVTCVFGELSGAKVVQKGVYAKMARGDMVRYMAENAVEDPEDMRGYARLGYEFDPTRSTRDEYVFLK